MSFKIQTPSENAFTLHHEILPIEADLNRYFAIQVGDYKFSAFIPPTTSNGTINDWMLCDGRILLRADYPDLFNVIGTNFTPNTTPSDSFNIPDFRGHVNAMPTRETSSILNPRPSGVSDYKLGDKVGTETVTLTTQQIPSHTHTNNSSTNLGLALANGFNTAGGGLDFTANEPNLYAPPTAVVLNSTGGNQPHNNMQPTLYGTNIYILTKISDYSTLSTLNLSLNVELNRRRF